MGWVSGFLFLVSGWGSERLKGLKGLKSLKGLKGFWFLVGEE
jgi:hypothetical protein